MMGAHVTREPSARRSPPGYRMVSVEPDERARTRMTVELAGIAPPPASSFDAVGDELGGGEPVVVLLGPGYANDTGLAQVQRLTRLAPHVGVVLLAADLTLPLLQQALRSGVRDVLTVDAGEAQVRQAIDRVGTVIAAIAARADAAVPATRGKVIVAFSTKGGVGKSVVATNLAVGLAVTHPAKVVLVDGDLQFGDVAVLLGIPPRYSVAEAVAAPDAELLEDVLATHEPSGLRVLCAPIEPAAAKDVTPEAMAEVVALLRTMYEFIVVDMPPHFDDLVLTLLDEADDVLLVASMDIPSIKNLKVGIQTLDLLALAGPKLRLVLNRANSKVDLDIADVERALGVKADFRIPSDIAVPQTVNRGVPVLLDRPQSAASLALARLVGTVEGRAELESTEPQPRRSGWRRSN